MKQISKIVELNDYLDDLPEVIMYEDGEEMVKCRLCFYYSSTDAKHKWTAAYHCSEYDYFVICGYGNTITEAVDHLRKLYKGCRKRREENDAWQLY